MDVLRNECTDKVELNVESVSVGSVWLRSCVSFILFHVLWNVVVIIVIECNAVIHI